MEYCIVLYCKTMKHHKIKFESSSMYLVRFGFAAPQEQLVVADTQRQNALVDA